MRKNKFIIVLFFLILFLGQIQAAINVQVRGSLDSSIFWTPENALDGLNRFALYSDINGIRNNINGYILFGGIDRRNDSFFQANPEFSMKVYRAWIRVSTPLFRNSYNNVTFTLGDLIIDYSPYTLKVGSWGSDVRRGLSFDGLATGPFVINGFVFSDQRPANLAEPTPGVVRVPQIAYGTKVLWQKGQTRITGIGVEYQELNPSWDEKNNSLVFAQPIEKDRVVSFELEQKIGELIIDGMYSGWHNAILGKEDKTGEIKQFSLILPLVQGVTLKAGWRNFEPGYNPRYRDKMPLFVYQSYRGWNPVDRYANQRGYYLEGNLKQQGYNLNLKGENYTNQVTNNQVKKGVLIGSLKGNNHELTVKCKNTTTFVDYRHGFTEHFEDFSSIVRLSKPFSFAALPMTRTYYFKTDSTNSEKFDSAVGIQLNWQLVKGNLAGAKFSLGAEKTSYTYRPLRIYSSFDYTMPGGIWVTCRWAQPNLLEPTNPEELWDEDFQEERVIDNFIGLGARVSF